MPLHIGIDLDNTIIDYDLVFGSVGIKLGLLPEKMSSSSKSTVKLYLCSNHVDGEKAWMRLQGQVYGRYIALATLKPGFLEALSFMESLGCRVSIVSHKTEYGHFDETKTNLHLAAISWLKERDILFHVAGITENDVYFAATLDEKVEKISTLKCDLFVDDLPAVLLHSSFPKDVAKVYYRQRDTRLKNETIMQYKDWHQITSLVIKSWLEKQIIS